MIHGVYLAAILVSAAGTVFASLRFRLGVGLGRAVLAASLTVLAFLAVDLVGASRGWFSSDPRFSLAILPGGVSFEEPFLLTFLALLAVILWRAAARLMERSR